MFYLVGLGLGDAQDITVKGLQVVHKAKRVYLEAYTSILTVGKDALEKYYGREVILADREMVEQNSDELLANADKDDVAFLVVGDPFGATTHSDLVLRAREKNIPYKVIHNASIMNAVGCCGLQDASAIVAACLYGLQFDSRVYKLSRLPDIKMKEQSIENLMRGRKVYEPPQFMTVSDAAKQLLEVITTKRQDEGEPILLSENSIGIGLARIGSDSQEIIVATLKEFPSIDLGGPLQSFVIPGEMHPLEIDMLRQFVRNSNVETELDKLSHLHLHST